MGVRYRGKDLRGRSFAGQSLVGADFREAKLQDADFSRADIRSARFDGADLTGANFDNAIAGRSRGAASWRELLFFVLGGAIAYLAIVLQVGLIAIAFNEKQPIPDRIGHAVGGVVALATQAALLRWGTRGLGAVAVAGAGAFASAFASAVAGVFAGVVAFAGTFGGAVAGAGASAGAVAGAVAGAFYIAIYSENRAFGAVFAIAVLAIGGLWYLCWLLWMRRRILRNAPGFEWPHDLSLRQRAWGGTSFRGADLTEASFDNAQLARSNFTGSIQQRTRFRNATGLDAARPGDSPWKDATLRDLIRSGNGAHLDLSYRNLSGVNLDNGDLSGAILKHTDLTGASLLDVNLRDANLAECQALGTDFRGADLTGATLEGWNIDHTTKLDGVRCHYFYMREVPDAKGNRDRRPHDPDAVLATGDFEKLFKKVIDTIQILIRNGVNMDAFREAMHDVTQEHPGVKLRALEWRDTDVLATFDPAPDTDKSAVERLFRARYGAIQINYGPVTFIGDGASGFHYVQGDHAGPVHITIRQEYGARLDDLRRLIADVRDLAEPDRATALSQVEQLSKASAEPRTEEAKSKAASAFGMLKGMFLKAPDILKAIEACLGLWEKLAEAASKAAGMS